MGSASKIVPTNPRLVSLLEDVTNGGIKIPVFQRAFVWSDRQVMSLLDSIYRGYPVGSLLMWATEPSNKMKHARNVGGFSLPDTRDMHPTSYVLDGQQRLTTLYGVFHSDSKASDPELAARFSVCYDPSNDRFEHSSAVDSDKTINMKDILDTTRLLSQYSRFEKAEQKRIAAMSEQFRDYEFPVVTIKDKSNIEVCRIFQRINSSGTSLSTFDLLAAWTWSDAFDLRKEIRRLLRQLATKGYGNITDTQVLRCLGAVALSDIEIEKLVDVDPLGLVAHAKTLREAMFSAIDFLEGEIFIKNISFLPFSIMLVPLVSFFALERTPDAEQRIALKKWFWHCAFTQRYKAGTNRHVMEDLGLMKRLATHEPVFDELTATVDPTFFLKKWSINSVGSKATICLLAQHSPRSFLTGRNIDLGQTLSIYNSRQFHHIYPISHLAKQGVTFYAANVLANICMLTADDNNRISDMDPAEYLKMLPQDERHAILGAAIIPEEFRDGHRPYAEFTSVRAIALARSAESLVATGCPLS